MGQHENFHETTPGPIDQDTRLGSNIFFYQQVLKNSQSRTDNSQASTHPALPELTISSNASTAHSDEIPDIALRLFPKIDKDNNGALSKDELAGAVKDKTIVGKDAQVVAGLYPLEPAFERLARDGKDGITRGDLEKYRDVQKRESDDADWALRTALFAEKHMYGIDKNRNGFVSKDELAEAAKQPYWSAHDRETINYMKEHNTEIAGYSDDEKFFEWSGITYSDMDAYVAHSLTSSMQFMMRRTAESQAGPMSLYAGTNPLDSIRPEAVKQGAISDCSLLASLKAIAGTHPEFISSMVKENRDGTYTVRFPGAPDKEYIVQPPAQTEMGLYASGGEYGTWVSVIEKAYGMHRLKEQSNAPVQEAADEPIEVTETYQLLTGQRMTEIAPEISDMHGLSNVLQRATERNLPIVAGVVNYGAERTSDLSFQAEHAYAIKAFDPTGPYGGTVTMDNPIGRGNGPDGVMKISLDEFRRNFQLLEIGEVPPHMHPVRRDK